MSSSHAATTELSPSTASLHGLDGVNFFLGGVLAGFGPYVAVYLADQKWTQEKIGFVLSASALAGLLSQVPGVGAAGKHRRATRTGDHCDQSWFGRSFGLA